MFLAGRTCPCGVLSSTSPTEAISVRSSCRRRTTIGILVAGLAEHRRLRAGQVRANGVGDAGDGHAEDGRLVAIDANGDFRTALFAADPRVGDAGRRVEQRLHVLREALGHVEVVAADLDGEAAAIALVAARHAAHLLAAGRARANDDAGKAGQLAPERHARSGRSTACARPSAYSRTLTLPLWPLLPPPKPPMPPPPADVISIVASGTAARIASSSRIITASVISTRVPTASSASTVTSPSSVVRLQLDADEPRTR